MAGLAKPAYAAQLLGMRPGYCRLLPARSGAREEIGRRGRACRRHRDRRMGRPDQRSMQRQELIVSQLAQAGIHINLVRAAPRQAMEGFMIKKQRAMLIFAARNTARSEPDPRAPVRCQCTAHAGSVELPGFRPLMDPTTEAQDRLTRKAAFAKLRRFVVERAMELPQFIAPAITIASPKVRNYRGGLLGTPKFTEVWLAA
jgi:hypothetical protein